MQQNCRLRRALRLRCIPGALLSFGLAAGAAEAGFDENVENALNPGAGKYGKVNFDLRYRFEGVNQEDSPPITKTAKASTARLRLGYLTPEFFGFKGFAEFQGNQDIFADDYNSTRNGKAQFPVVADPQAAEVGQLWLSYGGIPGTSVKGGRQRIILDNHRFIGNVGWRQLEQTFDSVAVSNTSLPHLTATAGFIWNVQDVFARHEAMMSPIVNIAYDGFSFGKIITYGYFLDYDDASDSGPLFKGSQPTTKPFQNSTQSYGIRFDGSYPIADQLKAVYTAEYARQQDYRKNPANYHADYWLTEAGLNVYGVTFKAAFEQLGAGRGDSPQGAAFQTPLATLHIFQGWADKFLVTPSGGIRDIYGTVATQLLGVDLMAVYHEFSDDTGNQDYGHEIDLQAEKKFGKHYSILLKFADYKADSSARKAFSTQPFSQDTQKWWIQTSVNF